MNQTRGMRDDRSKLGQIQKKSGLTTLEGSEIAHVAAFKAK